MLISINNILYALADSLDCVEHELFGATDNHSRRVAYMVIEMGKALGLRDKELLNLAASAVLHDNALTEYKQSELNRGLDVLSDKAAVNLKEHCVMGEDNVSTLPYFRETPGAILYHHEEADGTGPFGLTEAETPLFSQLIHIADIVDVAFDLGDLDYNKYRRAMNFADGSRGARFADQVVDVFVRVCTYGELARMDDAYISTLLKNALPVIPVDYTNENLEGISSMFARITDYKSSFTCRHSQGVADKARKMAGYYGYGEEETAKLYFAGALHDIGKLKIENDILEKPDSLTREEYAQIQTHAYATWEILGGIDGIDDIRRWASFHHEKLDGSGYPFGRIGETLDRNDRLMACIDIYQALTEPRPYKEGMNHEMVMGIMNKEVDRGALDGNIVRDIDRCFGD
jgi:HD-GYP domain-containing protein (c-di-GMP phosphodiesterase class II)